MIRPELVASLWTTRARVLFQYRAAALAGVVTQVFWGMLKVMVLTAFYESAADPMPIPLGSTITYIWLGQACFAMFPWRMDQELVAMFRQGRVAYELLRPFDLYLAWYSRHLAFLSAPTSLRFLPVLGFGALASGSVLPADATSGAAALVALAAGLALSSAILTTATSTLFWTVAGEGVMTLNSAAFFMFSGMLVPLPLFPDWFRRGAEWLPYRGVADLPFRLWTGHLQAGELAGVLAFQLGWTAILVATGRWLVRRGMARVVIQGG